MEMCQLHTKKIAFYDGLRDGMGRLSFSFSVATGLDIVNYDGSEESTFCERPVRKWYPVVCFMYKSPMMSAWPCFRIKPKSSTIKRDCSHDHEVLLQQLVDVKIPLPKCKCIYCVNWVVDILLLRVFLLASKYSSSRSCKVPWYCITRVIGTATDAWKQGPEVIFDTSLTAEWDQRSKFAWVQAKYRPRRGLRRLCWTGLTFLLLTCSVIETLNHCDE